MRENVQARGRLLLIEGRLVVQHVGLSSILAVCRGDSGVWHALGCEQGSWHCDCPARGLCAHLVALQLVVVEPGQRVEVSTAFHADRGP